MKNEMNRRRFLGTTAVAGAGLALNFSPRLSAATAKPAILGGEKLGGPSHAWPVFDQTEENALLEVLKSGKWFRGSGDKAKKFEEAYEKLTGAKHCIATSCGTTALLTALGTLGIGPGDEVILSPYTFIATFNVISLYYALPVFADTDINSFQIDPKTVEARITDKTKLILPVHVGGSVVDLDAINDIAKKRKVAVIEDACQAHLGEWKNRHVGNWGLAGCFSFQASKNLNSGEGGAVITNDDTFAEQCYNFHNQGRGRGASSYNFSYSGDRGANFRLSEFQANLLLAQMTRLQKQSDTRTENANYLTKMLSEIPGIKPAKPTSGQTRSAYHLYMFRFDSEKFAGMKREKFIEALGKEGIGASAGYSSLNKDSFVVSLAKNPHYQRIYGAETMAKWQERNSCPNNEKLCQEAVWFTQTMLLGPKSEMETIAEAIRRIQAHAGEIVKA